MNRSDLSCDYSLLRPVRHPFETIVSPKVDTQPHRAAAFRHPVIHGHYVASRRRYSLTDNEIHRHRDTALHPGKVRGTAPGPVFALFAGDDLVSWAPGRLPRASDGAGPRSPCRLQVPKGVVVC